MRHDAWIERLQAIVGPADIIRDADQLASYAGDECPLPDYRRLPTVVVRPHNTPEVAKILKLANQEKIPVTARGGGTGLCGGCVPAPGGMVLTMDHFNRVLEVD